jgi:hypothetical protein
VTSRRAGASRAHHRSRQGICHGAAENHARVKQHTQEGLPFLY